MAARASVFLILLFLAKSLEREDRGHWIVWNVGQGQWVTLVESDACWHFDMGGEFAPWAKIMRECRARRNSVFLSHWDSDHINFAGRARYFLPNLCRWGMPVGITSAHKRRSIERLQECDGQKPFASYLPTTTSKSNDNSGIVVWKKFLLPGDSSSSAEKIWSYKFANLQTIRYLALGHHGSRTSSSALLLEKLTQLQLTIASARRRRYGHPHHETVERLRSHGVPVLSTEDWGNVYIWL